MSLWDSCKLDGDDLNAKVCELENSPAGLDYISDWSLAGPIIERDHIFLEAPHSVHCSSMSDSAGETAGRWEFVSRWRATVSAATRTRPNRFSEHLPEIVGRGEGETALIAAMRAYVDSKAIT